MCINIYDTYKQYASYLYRYTYIYIKFIDIIIYNDIMGCFDRFFHIKPPLLLNLLYYNISFFRSLTNPIC